MLKEWIKDKLFTKTGKFNNRVVVGSWWSSRPSYTIYMSQIVDDTRFLGEEASITERVYCIINDVSSKKTCICGNFVKFKNMNLGYRNYCSLECSYVDPKRNQKIKEKLDYGSIMSKVKKTNLEKYGVEYTTQIDDMKELSKQTKLKRYGDSFYNNHDKAKETNLIKYGVEYTGKSEKVKKKIEDTKQKRRPMLRNKNWLENENQTQSLVQISDKIGVTRRTVDIWFKRHGLQPNFFIPSYGKQQGELLEFVKSICSPNTIIHSNDRNAIKPKELDIYIPSKKIAIELNGMYWHANDRKRHLEKLQLCEENKIKLLQFWDKEWSESPEICKSIIRHCFGLSPIKIYAKHTIAKDITEKDYREFLQLNHIQNYHPAKYKFGLFYDDELVACIGLGKSRFKKTDQIEIIRFCMKLNCNIVGAFSKLLKHSNFTNLISYCDRRIFSGTSYVKTGFNLSHITSPGYVYYKQGKVMNRINAQKHKLKTLLPNFDWQKTEKENMANHGWVQVWDCGQLVFVKK